MTLDELCAVAHHEWRRSAKQADVGVPPTWDQGYAFLPPMVKVMYRSMVSAVVAAIEDDNHDILHHITDREA